LLAAGLIAAAAQAQDKPARKTHASPPARQGGTVVSLCDGETSVEVKGLKPGQAMSREQAQAVSNQLMADWRKKNPNAHWDEAPPSESKQSGVYENFSSRDELVWATETQKFVELGSAIFHSDQQLGGTIGVSCDMCHPNAANTHPETYPKYQVQLQRVAFLRDMINWCIENPVKGHPLADDDPKLRAIEAYILAQRKGAKLDYGKH